MNPDSVVQIGLYDIPNLLMNRLDVAWTFLLLLTRFVAFFSLVPGIGGGVLGLVIRYPAAAIISFSCLNPSHTTPVASDGALMAAQLASEVLFGATTALIPLMIIAGAQAAGQIASLTMGLNGAQLIDPTTSAQLPDLARIYGDLTVILFLMMGGHHVAIAQLSGLGSEVQPGSFIVTGFGVEALVDQSSRIFYTGVMIASPVIVALLLTNFVMGVISKAVPAVNIFIISFPLTIFIGLSLSVLSLPEASKFLQRDVLRIESVLSALAR